MKKATMFARSIGGMLLMAVALSSQATTISFTGAPEGGVFTSPTGSGNGPSQYTAQGFEFFATGYDGHFHQNITVPDSLYMHSNYSLTTNTWVLAEVGNGLFDVTSFTMDSGALNWVTNLGTTGTTSLGLNNVGLHGITSLTFSLEPNNGYGSMDEFVVNPSAVPEPATGALFVAGLGILGFAVRRRKQSTAA
jgi:hypothetical protein